MKSSFEVSITDIEFEIKIPSPKRPDDILAFVEIIFLDSETARFKVKGTTIKEKVFSGKKVLSVQFPAYKSGFKYQTSFIIDDKSLYKNVCDLILKEFAELNGYESYKNLQGNELVNPEDIPF